MAVTHSAFGLVLNSNLPIPGLTASQTLEAADIQIQLGSPPFPANERQDSALFFESSYLGESGEPALQIWKLADGEFFHLTYFDGVQFWLDREGRRIWATWSEERSIEEMATYLIGPVLGFVLRLRGTTCLHASAVSVQNRAIAFVGAAGAGKSTTAATLARGGCAVLSDDMVSLREQDGDLYAMPSFPFLSLWPESVKLLYGSTDSLPRFTSDWDKRRLSPGTGGVTFQTQPLLLGAVYVFGERTGATEPNIEDMAPQTALMSLVANTYATSLLNREMRAREFEVLGKLVAHTPVRQLLLPRGAGRPAQLFELISQDCHSLLKTSLYP